MRKILCLAACALLCLTVTLAVAEGAELPSVDERLAAEGRRGGWVTWSVEDLRAYQYELDLEGTLLDEAPEGWLSREEVLELGISRILELDELLQPQVWYDVKDPVTVTEELLRSLSWNAVPAEQTETGQDVWYLWIYDPDWLVPAMDCYDITLDAHTGEVLSLFTPGGWG